jgi:hypothetical protein
MSDPLKSKRETWTEEEVKLLPEGEQSYFDRKAGALLLDLNNFEEKIGKALSAFANSGGGHIVLGVTDDGVLDGVPKMQKKGKTTTKEWLEQKLPGLVDRRLQDMTVHEVVSSSPSDIPPGMVVIVVDVGDSDLAPHQSVKDKIYYHRTTSHSMPAPHFYLEMLWGRERYPNGRVVRAWFDTVINPLLGALESEYRTIEKRIWRWDRYKKEVEGVGPLCSISVNLEQFFLSHEKTRELLERHDAAVLHLRNKVSEYYEAVKSGGELKKAYKKAIGRAAIQRMVDANPVRFESYKTDEARLQTIMGPPEEHLATLSAAIVSEIGKPLENTWGHAPFWNINRELLMGVIESNRLQKYRERAQSARQELISAIEVAEVDIKAVRKRLGQRYGEPYVMPTAVPGTHFPFTKYQ